MSRTASRNGVLASDPALSADTCHICGREPGAPRVYTDAAGRITEACVGAIHGRALIPTTTYAAWWSRPEAVQIRLAERRNRLGR